MNTGITLDTPLGKVLRITRDRMPGLAKLGLKTVRDLLYHLPVRYSLKSEVTLVADIADKAIVTVYGRLLSIETTTSYRTKKPMVRALLEDTNGEHLEVTWFNQLFIGKTLREGELLRLSGTASVIKDKPTLINPDFVKVKSLPIDIGQTLFANDASPTEELGEAIYRETRGVTSLYFRHSIKTLFQNLNLESLPDPIPDQILNEYSLPPLASALRWIHCPLNERQLTAAKKRFSFEYIFLIQMQQQLIRASIGSEPTYSIKVTDTLYQTIKDRLSFTLTGGQSRITDTIREDLARGVPMQRLLEGDVGSGKTAIASIVASLVVANHPKKPDGRDLPEQLQVAYMAPTEVLATQLYESFVSFFRGTNMQIVLLTGKTCRKYPSKSNPNTWTDISRAQAQKWIKNGEIPIVIGTHTLIQKKTEWKHLAMVIIDEQHRFGTQQRATLTQNEGLIPHYLSMSATPIPRTLALTLYGDLDISVLDEVPPGRKPVLTSIVPPNDRPRIYDHIRELLAEGRQAYIICPRVDEQDPEEEVSVQMRSAVGEADRLAKTEFTDYTVGVMHSRLGKEIKAKTMEKFATGEIDVLVSTSVIEVGVNVPNATIIVIEGSDRFGLSQLHQLRGRVMRSSHQPHCYLFTDSKSEKTTDRLKSFIDAKSGFELAEMDLHHRGAGNLVGAKQWGITDIGMEAIKNIRLVEAARSAAQKIIATDRDLKNHPVLAEIMQNQSVIPHFE
jgi:ATP-dependent DNA helicase RecG